MLSSRRPLMRRAFDLTLARKQWLLVAGLCFLVGTVEGLGMLPRKSRGLTNFEEMALHWVHWTVWACLFPIFLGLVRRFPLVRGRRTASLAAYVLVGPPVFALHGVLHLLVVSPMFPTAVRSWPHFLDGVLSLDAGYRAMGYSFLLALTWSLEYHDQAMENARRAAAFESQLARAELDALKMQLHPHFLFNTLNSIATLLHRDPEAADRMVARLGDFLRLTLENDGGALVSLDDELRFVRGYLGIEEVRFSDRLSTRIEVTPEAAEALVPNLLLQPLVENAIRHGIQRRTDKGTIVVRGERTGDRLRLEVWDDGPGLDGTPLRPGRGLTNTAARLSLLYGGEHRMDAGSGPDTGFRVVVETPYRTAPPSACAS